MKGYKVMLIDMMGYENEKLTKYFILLTDAKAYLKDLKKKRIKHHGKLYVKPKDVEEIRAKFTGHTVNDLIAEEEVCFDYKCSYEYDEWDTASENILLKEIEIDRRCGNNKEHKIRMQLEKYEAFIEGLESYSNDFDDFCDCSVSNSVKDEKWDGCHDEECFTIKLRKDVERLREVI